MPAKKISKSAGAKDSKRTPSPKNTTKYKTSWDFSDMYSGPSDPKLEKDTLAIKADCLAFAKKYSSNDDYLSDEKKLLTTLNDYDKLIEKIGSSLPVWYLMNMQNIDGENNVITANVNRLSPILTESINEILFFTLKLAKIPKSNQTSVLKNISLKKYHYLLKKTFDNAKHDLSEEVEKVLNLKSQPSNTMWVDGFEKTMSKQVVVFKGKKLPISEAMSKISSLPTKDRHELHESCMLVLKSLSDFAESEINAVYTDKKIEDQLRGFSKPYEASILSYENDIKNIELLVKTVTDNFSIAHRFYKLKAKALGLKELTYADRAVGIGKNVKKVSFDKTVEIIRSAFGKAGGHYADILDTMLKNGRIDVYPKKGKRAGAYCWGGQNAPTIIMLNHIDSITCVMTLAHEMGHAIHTELAREQPAIYENYTMSVAEVASTFFENLAFEEMFEKLNDKEKVVALHNQIADNISTIFRQVACFNFELELHTKIREKGFLSASEISALHNKHMSAYLGPVAKLTENDGYFFEAWGHIRRYFYVYSYAYGALVSRSLYEKCKADKSFYAKVDSFMKAGKSMSPEDIFKSIGVDVTNPSFYLDGLKSIEKDIERLEKLLKKSSK